MSKDNSVSFGIGLLFGVVAGVVTGVLFSPKPGEDMRKDLRVVADKVLDKLNPDVEKAKFASIDLIEKVKYTVENQLGKLNEAVKAGRMAAAKRKEELDSGYNI